MVSGAKVNMNPPSWVSTTCGPGGNSAELSWGTVSGADYYPLRVDKAPRSWDEGYWNANCGSWSMNSYNGDYCQSNLSYSHAAISILPDTDYNWWVHSLQGSNWSSLASQGYFKCPSTYSLSLGMSGSGNITSSPGGINCSSGCSGSFSSKSWVTLSATPTPGYIFTGWSGAGCSGSGSCSVYMDSNKSVTATFTQAAVNYTLNVYKGGAGSGTIRTASPNSWDINCGSACLKSYQSGTNVTIVAEVAPGSTFTGWSGGVCADTNTTCSFPMTGNTVVTASFTLPQSLDMPGNLAYSFIGGGLVRLSWATVPNATYYSFRYDKNYNSFDAGYWDTNCADGGSWYAGDYCQNKVYGTSIYMDYDEAASYKWWVHARDAAGNWSSAAENTFKYVVSTPAPTGLSHSCSADGKSVTLSWNPASGAIGYALRADYNPSSFSDLAFTGGGVADCYVSSAGAWYQGDYCQSVDLTGTSKTIDIVQGGDYIWWVHTLAPGGWSEASFGVIDDACHIDSPPPPSSPPPPIMYTLSVQKNGAGNVISSPSGIACGTVCSQSYESGQVVSLIATPLNGYNFSSWNNCDLPTGNICNETVSENKIVTANFTACPGSIGFNPASPKTNTDVKLSFSQAAGSYLWSINGNDCSFIGSHTIAEPHVKCMSAGPADVGLVTDVCVYAETIQFGAKIPSWKEIIPQ